MLGFRNIALFLLFANYIILGKQDKISNPQFPHLEILVSIPLPLLNYYSMSHVKKKICLKNYTNIVGLVIII